MRKLVLVLLVGCATPQKAFEPQTVEAEAGVTDKDLYSAAVRVLADEGYSFRDKDSDAGLVSTDWVEVGNMMEDKIQHSWRASIVDGELRLLIDCQMYSPSLGKTYECQEGKRVSSWVEKSDALLEKIQSEARRRARKREAHDSSPY